MSQELLRRPTETVTIAADATSGSFAFSARGRLHSIVLKTNLTTNNVTFTLTILNSNGDEIYNSTAKVHNATHMLNELSNKVPLVGDHTCTITLSGVPGVSTGIANVTMYIE